MERKIEMSKEESQSPAPAVASSPAHSGGWNAVDRTGRVDSFVRCLDGISAFEAARSLKLRTFSLLQPPGRRLLDVGCGPGDDARILAGMVGPEGAVVGIDFSEGMIAEARKRAGEGLPLEFRVGDAQALDFPDGSFDGCRADRVLQHLDDPGAALAEMARVTRPGGHVVVVDPDWDTLLVDHDDRAVTRRILNHESDTHKNGWSGRRLYALLRDAGLTEVGVTADTWSTNDIAVLKATFNYVSMVDEAVAANVVSRGEGDRWLAHLEERVAAGRFYGALTLFTGWGRRPEVEAVAEP